jgi:hypothetical protein
MLPSASTTLNTARVEPSGDRPRYAVPTAPRLRAPGSSCVGRRGVRLPANTPPACKFGAPASGAPSGSRIVDVPIPCKPLGALAGQRRPKALLIEIPSGLLTPVKPADAAVLQLCRSGLICWASLRHRFVVCSSGGNSNGSHPSGGWLVSAFSLSYRHVEELLAERGLHADHVTVWRRVQR